MLSIILVAGVLVAITVVVHVAGLGLLLVGLRRWHSLFPTRIWHVTRLLLGMSWYLILLHVLEISFWGWFYQSWGHLPDSEAALYFSAVTYTTVGYGDLVLTKPWRLLAPIEALTGILMCGLSTSFFFAVVIGINQARHGKIIEPSTTDQSGLEDLASAPIQ
jgi:hypothetical protein